MGTDTAWWCVGPAVTRLTGKQAELFPSWRYHAFITDREGTAVFLDADHRRHAVVELVIRDLKDGAGMAHCPSGDFNANAAWAVLATAAKDRDLSYFPPECELAELEACPPVFPGPDALTNEPDPDAPVLSQPSAEERQRAESLVAVMAGASPLSHRGGPRTAALAGLRQALRAPVGYDVSFTRQFCQAVTADPFAPTEDCQVAPSQSP